MLTDLNEKLGSKDLIWSKNITCIFFTLSTYTQYISSFDCPLFLRIKDLLPPKGLEISWTEKENECFHISAWLRLSKKRKLEAGLKDKSWKLKDD